MKKIVGIVVGIAFTLWLLAQSGGHSGVGLAGAVEVGASRPQSGAMQHFAATWLGAERSGSRSIAVASSVAAPTAATTMYQLPASAWPTAEAEHELGYTPRGSFGLEGGSMVIEKVADADIAAATPQTDNSVVIEAAPAATPPATPPAANPALRRATTGDYRLDAAPSISVATIEQVLSQYHSPAVGNGQAFYDLGVKYGVDPAFMLAFYVHESAAGTMGAAVQTKSVGNIICAGWEGNCIGRFRAYDSYAEAAEDWYQLITGSLYIGAGLDTPEKITPRYAPDNDNNDSAGYAKTVERLVDGWRKQ
jgi:hypothetical protein